MFKALNIKKLIIKMVNKIEIMEGTKYSYEYKVKYQVRAIEYTIKKIRKLKELELSTGYKSNRRRLNYRLLNNESITLNQYTYFKNNN